MMPVGTLLIHKAHNAQDSVDTTALLPLLLQLQHYVVHVLPAGDVPGHA
jgi:hypothetical protein